MQAHVCNHMTKVVYFIKHPDPEGIRIFLIVLLVGPSAEAQRILNEIY